MTSMSLQTMPTEARIHPGINTTVRSDSSQDARENRSVSERRTAEYSVELPATAKVVRRNCGLGVAAVLNR